MLKFVTGDIFQSKAQTLVNTVNCVGVMGKGIALEFKKRFPTMFKRYTKHCKEGKIKIGKLYLYKETIPWVLNFPTKNHYREKSQLSYIEDGLKYLCKNYRKMGITSLAMPALGCQLGGLEWHDVKSLINKYLVNIDIEIEVYEPL